jgi:hypothetical protein
MNDTQETTLQTVASEAASWFETATRGDTGNDEDRYVRVRDGAPEWVRDMVYSAHADMLPDDWRYQCIRAAVEAISECEDYDAADDYRGEFADGMVDAYNHARIEWLGSHGSRLSYCDEAAEEMGAETHRDIMNMIGLGQFAEADEVYGLVFQSLEARMDEVD